MSRKKYEIAFELAGRLGSSFGGMFKSADTHFARLNKNISRMKLGVRELDRNYKHGKISAERYAAAHNKLSSQLLRAERAQQRLNRAVQTHKKVADMRGNLRGQMFDNVARAAVAVAPVAASIDYESSFAGVRKTVDATEAEFAAFNRGFRDMTKDIPAAATEIAKVGEVAGQLGIQNDAILGFTRTMIDMGESTNMVSEEAAGTLARFANITKMSQQDFDRLGSTVVDLGNNFATMESEIVEMALRLAGAGAQVKMSEADILALAAALSSVGIEAEMGGSALSRVIVRMQVAATTGLEKVEKLAKRTGMSLRDMQLMAANSSSDFNDLADSLGMTNGEMKSIINAGVDLENFAKIAKMSGEQFKQAFQEDAISALGSFVNGLGTAEEAGESAINMLEEMGITEIRLRDSLLRTGNANELFANAVEIANNAWEENTALANEAEERYKTTASQLKILRNRVVDTGISIGNILLPSVNDLAGKLGDIADKIQAWAEKHPTLTKYIVYGTTAVVGLGVAMSTLGYAAVLLVSPFAILAKLIAKMRTYPALANSSAKATRNWAAAQNALNSSYLTGGGIGGVGAGGKGKGKGKGLGGKGLGAMTPAKNMARGLPFAGAAFGAIELLMADGAMEKGRAAGGMTGGLIGGLAGSALGPVGAIGGAALGNWLGGEVGKKIAEFQKQFTDRLLPEVELFDKKVSEKTQKTLGAFMDMSQEVAVKLNDLAWSGRTLTEDMAKDIVSTYRSMNDQILKGMEESQASQTQAMDNFFTNTKNKTEWNQKEIMEKVSKSQEEERQKIEEGQQKIEEIIRKDLHSRGQITEQNRQRINEIQANMEQTAIQVMSESVSEQTVILERLKRNASLISAEQASEVIKNSYKQKQETIAEADKQYDGVIKWALEQKEVHKTITAQEYKAITDEAERQREEVVKEAEEMHRRVVEEAELQAGEHAAAVDKETGEILSSWQLLQKDLVPVFANIAKTGISVWEKVKDNLIPPRYRPNAEPRPYYTGPTSAKNKPVGGMGDVSMFARGGFVNRPVLGMVGEAGPEMIIPIDGSERAKSLLAQTNSMLGFGGGSGDVELPSSFGNSTSQTINMTYAPVINGVSKEEVQPVLENHGRNFLEQFNDVMHQRKRVSFT